MSNVNVSDKVLLGGRKKYVEVNYFKLEKKK